MVNSSAEEFGFGVVDYVVLAAVLTLSAAIGVYFGWKDKNDSTTDNYFFGKKALNPLPLCLSIIATSYSAIGLLSEPAEVYLIGNASVWYNVASFLSGIPTIIYFIPAFRRLGLKTKFEFLELRFNGFLRRAVAIVGTLGSLFYAALIVYLSSTTLSVVTSIPEIWGIVICTGVCVFYTSLGGMKAVVWTDTLQIIFMLAGVSAFIIKGLIAIGGFDEFFSALARGERYTAHRFDYGIIARVSPLGIFIGRLGSSSYAIAFQQQLLQRYQSFKTTSQARWGAAFNMTVGGTIGLIALGIGLIIFGLFESCDPQLSGKITSIDQITSFAALYLLSDIAGMAGLYIASIFSAGLSTVSSILNSYSIVALEDILCVYWKRLRRSEALKVFVSQLLVLILGLSVAGIAIAASYSNTNIVQLLFSFTGIINGPSYGLYLLGFFCPRSSSKGGTIGFTISFMFGLFLFIGNEFFKVPYPASVPPRFTYGCSSFNATTEGFVVTTYSDTTHSEIERSALQDLFNLNFNFFIIIGMGITVVIGYFASLLTGPNDPNELDPKLFIPLLDNKLFPQSVRRFFRFGVPEIDQNISQMSSDKDMMTLEEKL